MATGQIVRHLHPQMTATNTADYVTDDPEAHLNSAHPVLLSNGRAFLDPKRDNRGLTPVTLAEAERVTIFDPQSKEELVKEGE